MLRLFNAILKPLLKRRMREIAHFMHAPLDTQQKVFNQLLHTARHTAFGKQYGFAHIMNYDQYRQNVPVQSYESLFPYIERQMKGEQNLLWPTPTRWFSKSSGTTNARSKFIPVSPEALTQCHFKGGKDLLAMYINHYPDTKIFTGKSLAIGGSYEINSIDPRRRSAYGDISAVIMQNLPVWAQFIRTPTLEVALMSQWEEKMEKMAQSTARAKVTNLSGVPTWVVPLIQRIVEREKAETILDLWPHLEVFFHGAVAFGPYRSLFKQLIPSSAMRYVETYTASEGFFGIQYQPDSEELLLMLDYGIFYEFIPYAEIHKAHPKTIGLGEVELGKSYALVISTNAGLWRYHIGDTVKFTSLRPFCIKITGRTKHFINAFGEELVIENAETAMAKACAATGASIENFTAAPIHFAEPSEKGGHEWVVEFRTAPDSLAQFVTVLDDTLRAVNSDYDAKRQGEIALKKPTLHAVQVGTFYRWMKKRKKLGGQNKVPRLANHREYLDDILAMTKAANA